MPKRQSSLKKPLILDWYKASSFAAYDFNPLKGFFFKYVARHCLSGNVPFFVFEGGKI